MPFELKKVLVPDLHACDLYQMKSSDTVQMREQILVLQNYRCVLCTKNLRGSTEACLDHQHRKKKSTIGEDGGGLLRGVLCRNCNVLEGKIWNVSTHRHKRKRVELPAILRRLASYYESGWYPIVHHYERPKCKAVSKRQYNKLCKAIRESNADALKPLPIPPFPKTKQKKITKALSVLFSRFKIDPYTSPNKNTKKKKTEHQDVSTATNTKAKTNEE